MLIKRAFGHIFKYLPSECNGFSYGSRYFFTKSSLGMDQFLEQVTRSQTNFAKIKDKFFQRMQTMVATDSEFSKDMIFTEDLKNAVYLVQSDEDVNLLTKLIERYNPQNAELRFSIFRFGPIVMRQLHHLNKPQIALELLINSKNSDFFGQAMSYILTADLLFRNAIYQEILDVYDNGLSASLSEIKNARDLIVIVLGACHKLNTEESYKYALSLMKKAREVHNNIQVRGVSIFGSFASSQNDATAAIEAVSLYTNAYVSIRNVRIMALLGSKRMEHGLSLLQSVLNDDRPNFENKAAIFSDTLSKARKLVEAYNNKETMAEFMQIERALIESKRVSNQTLDELLFADMDLPSKRAHNDDEPSEKGRFRNGFVKRRARVGLTEPL